jgi:hypothetical protein
MAAKRRRHRWAASKEMRFKRDRVRPGVQGGAIAASIEILSFVLAELLGVPALLHANSSAEVVLVYTFGIACGGLGSRLSAMWRERASEQLPDRG